MSHHHLAKIRLFLSRINQNLHPETRSEFAQILSKLRPEFYAAMGFTALVNLLLLTPTLYMLQIFDRVLLSHSGFSLFALTLVMAFFLIVLSFSEWIRARLLVRVGVKFDMAVNGRLFHAALAEQWQNPSAHSAESFQDLAQIRQFLTGNGLFAFLDLPWSLIYLAVLFLLHPVLGWLALFFATLMAFFSFWSGKQLQRPIKAAQDTGRDLRGYLRARLRNAEAIVSMGMQARLAAEHADRSAAQNTVERIAQDRTQRLQSAAKFITLTQQSLTLAAGALLVIAGDLTPGAMIAANALMGRATQPFSVMLSTWKNTLAAKDAFLRLEQLLARHPALPAVATPTPPTTGGPLIVRQLSAHAPGHPLPVLADLSFTIPGGGAVVGVVGPSGSGKSTLLQCLMGIWPQAQLNGTIDLSGQSLANWPRTAFGYLPQDVELGEGSIAENIARFGQPNAQAVVAACQQAGAHEMILRLPQGYDTRLTERRHLSGGQRQRIALARAFYGNPALLTLDEPDSSLDDEGRAVLLAALKTAKAQGQTVFIATHHQHILEAATHLLVLEQGRLARQVAC
ncbi:MAG: type I secretion system permease/ATPase [Zoogloeaceae bacterium]|jgi:ATP-binding cassette subfamily C exporter for protease/lipase|nr:type I secretion system permease/ATPase [Zoogloeaceae bacterium]